MKKKVKEKLLNHTIKETPTHKEREKREGGSERERDFAFRVCVDTE